MGSSSNLVRVLLACATLLAACDDASTSTRDDASTSTSDPFAALTPDGPIAYGFTSTGPIHPGAGRATTENAGTDLEQVHLETRRADLACTPLTLDEVSEGDLDLSVSIPTVSLVAGSSYDLSSGAGQVYVTLRQIVDQFGTPTPTSYFLGTGSLDVVDVSSASITVRIDASLGVGNAEGARVIGTLTVPRCP